MKRKWVCSWSRAIRKFPPPRGGGSVEAAITAEGRERLKEISAPARGRLR